ncbi:MAG: Re/Si-specific NAD(P)(+) transhydrogenase subunit beta, partial [Alteromonadales bacterium]|nr:Re/Si-specific NAD(P)(+) transhydrogenase subunit beta [Alteromonadales bacterium]
MSQGLITAAYIIAAILFIASLNGLSSQESARKGNLFGIIGMIIAIVATIASSQVSGLGYITVAMALGAAIGVRLALKVEMTSMPELIAILHSFVGLAAAFIGFNSYLDHGILLGAAKTIHDV